MPDLTVPKQNAASSLIQFAKDYLAIYRRAKNLYSFCNDNGYATGGGNVYVDADFSTVPGLKHLSASQVLAVISALNNNITLTAGQIAVLEAIADSPTA